MRRYMVLNTDKKILINRYKFPDWKYASSHRPNSISTTVKATS